MHRGMNNVFAAHLLVPHHHLFIYLNLLHWIFVVQKYIAFLSCQVKKGEFNDS